jgi:chromosome partition protein MukF
MVEEPDTENAGAPLNVADTVAKVLVSEFSLQVSTIDAAFLCGIHARMELARQPSLEEEELESIFVAVTEASISDGQALPQRAVMAIQRLRKQGLLERADARGVAGLGMYTLSSLGTKLRDEIFERETLTRRSLRVMMKRVIADLSMILRDAQKSAPGPHWLDNVVDPLRHLVQEVIRSIARRQKGLEAEQGEIRKQIHALLKSDNWKDSIDICNRLLQTTGNTLEELHKILMEEMGAAQNLLTEIGMAAQQQDQTEAYDMSERLQNQIDAINTWSNNFRATWSDYYTKTHEFIRFSIRVDPNRKLSQRLRQSLKDYRQQPWYLRLPAGDKYRHLRDEDDLPTSKLLSRVSVKPQREATDVTEEREALHRALIAAASEQLQRDGALQLSSFLQPYLPTLDDDELFMAIGTLQAWLLRHADPVPKREADWVTLRGAIELQEVRAVARPLPLAAHPTFNEAS